MQLLNGETLKDRLGTVKDSATGTFIGKPLAVDELLPLAMRESGKSQHAIERFLRNERLHLSTRKALQSAIDRLEQQIANH
jgi:hypothetical protein